VSGGSAAAIEVQQRDIDANLPAETGPFCFDRLILPDKINARVHPVELRIRLRKSTHVLNRNWMNRFDAHPFDEFGECLWLLEAKSMASGAYFPQVIE